MTLSSSKSGWQVGITFYPPNATLAAIGEKSGQTENHQT
jgi:hypothetical protein